MLAAGEEHDADGASKFSLASDIVELVVLTADNLFLTTLREAVGGSVRLWHVPAPDKVSDLLLAGDVGILVLDGAMVIGNNAAFVEQLKHQFPELVILYAGTREDESMLAGLISRGSVYRFIHKPMSSARARLFVQAAIRKYDDPRSTMVMVAPAKPRKHSQTLLLGGGIVTLALLIVSIVAWQRLRIARSDFTDSQSSTNSEAADPLLLRAADALAANRLTEPSGDNALEFYLAKLARSPSDATARAGLAEVHERLLARAENALLEERLDEAGAAIDGARRAGVEGGRIAFLSAQLNKAREQFKQAQSRARIQTELRASEDKLAQALQNTAQRETGARLLLEARSAMQSHDFDKSSRLLQAATGLSSQADIDTVRAALATTRIEAQTQSREKLLKLANERLQQDRLLDPANDNAKFYLAGLRALDPTFAGLAPATQDFGGRLLVKARRALSLGQHDAAGTWLDEAVAAGYSAQEIAVVRGELETASHTPAIVSGLALTRIDNVQPEYPIDAARRRLDGWVDLEFTVKPDGRVGDTLIRNAQPAGVFDQAAVKAVEQWRFKPVLRDNKAIEQRARIRVRFSLNP